MQNNIANILETMNTFTTKMPLFNGENYVLGKVQRPPENEVAKLKEFINRDMDVRCEITVAMEPSKVNLIKNIK